eukprot:scaffold345_cov134-Cylindrotheca_fusiformis.AAC.92
MDDSASSSSSSSSSSSPFLNPNDSIVDADVQGISLLREIFPDESLKTLRAIHATRLSKCHEDSASYNSRGNYLDDEETTNTSPMPSAETSQLAEMEERVLQDHHHSMLLGERRSEEVYYFTAVVHRDPYAGGLGMTLEELPNGNVHVCGLKPIPKNPSAAAGIRRNDELIGVNGSAFATCFPLNSEYDRSNKTRMKQIVQAIQQSPSPIVLHVQRATTALSKSLLDASSQDDLNYIREQQQEEKQDPIHPFAKVLEKRKLLQSNRDVLATSNTIHKFVERARQWESTTTLTTPSTPHKVRKYGEQHQTFRDINTMDGIRQALSTRIVNYFVEDGNRIAYTIWVYDGESGKEWYAPLRYLEDFSDLRAAVLALIPQECDMKDLELPKTKSNWLMGSRRDTLDQKVLQENSRQLESFLRVLCRLMYSASAVNPNVTEIAIHVQSFLGTDTGLSEGTDNEMDHPSQSSRDSHTWNDCKLLKRGLQRYVWRLFQLDIMQEIVDSFVDSALARSPNLQEIEFLEAQGREKLKARSMEELEQIQLVLNELVNLILEGCQVDLKLIAQHQEYETMRTEIIENDSNWDRLVREAVREQVEIEVYVPLRSVVSRLLVNGWRHEDMEIQELNKRPQSRDTFGIPQSSFSPSHWESAAVILKRGVGNSTLPCAKLRAIVRAAREVSRLHVQEHEGQGLIGADNFLPIFVFCVVKANLERPCALLTACAGVLLTTLCDKPNAIGEIGYFLASFEAVIEHLREMNVDQENERMTTIPLAEISLNE